MESTLALQIPHLLTPVLISSIIKSIIKQLIYLRQQIPMPFADLENTVATWDSARRLTSSERKMLRFYESSKLLFQTIDEVLLSHHLSRMALVLGTTPSCFKEVFLFEFDQCEGPSPPARVIDDLARRSVLAMIQRGPSYAVSLPPTNIFLLLDRPALLDGPPCHPGSPIDLDGPEQVAEVPTTVPTRGSVAFDPFQPPPAVLPLNSVGSLGAIPHFRAREGLSLQPRRAGKQKIFTVALRMKEGVADGPRTTERPHSPFWLLCEVSLKGLRPLPST
ncbi:hypothetical protein PAPYR_3170 [Paratrimastix pyriformis]|uniref:Uncharacterized protein n=1 Tax=Paratrimastix pyriformis TaxID=342808 RepID=A0ABQ8UR56_9EUKA|nr:hypothetical protein PAPYR_3170 [Paratrimastix pyriformis]